MNNDWLDIELLEDYLDGKLDAKAMHRIERQALEDPFVAQALAGLSESPKRVSASVSILQKQLYERIAQQQVVQKESVFTWQRLSVAAAAAVMFTSVSILFFMRDKENRRQLAKNEPRKIEVNIAPSPAVVDSAKSDAYAATITAEAAAPVTMAKAAPGRTKQVQAEISPDTTVLNSAMAKVATVSSARVAAVVAPAVSTPIGGWAAFDTYLTDNNKLGAAKAGKFVELSFLIDSDGNTLDIKIEKAAGKEFDDEALRLIKEGPKWEKPGTPDSRMTYTISF